MIHDITVPWSPRHLATIQDDGEGTVRDVAAAGSVVFLASRHDGIGIMDVSDPTVPQELGAVPNLTGVEKLLLNGDHLYVARWGHGLTTIDVSDPAWPDIVGNDPRCDRPNDLAMDGDLLVAADGYDGIFVYDLSNPRVPAFAGSIDAPRHQSGVALSGATAYVGTSHHASGLFVVDCSDRTAPEVVGYLDAVGSVTDMVFDDHGRLVVGSAVDGLLLVAPWCGAFTSVDPVPAPPPAALRAYPNPFNPRTTLVVDVARPGHGTVQIHDLRGRLVRTLHAGQLAAGTRSFTWDGEATDGRPAPSGSYLARFRGPDGVSTAKLLLAR